MNLVHTGTLFEHLFIFTSENAIFHSSIVQAVTLSLAVREQLSVDACAPTLALNDISAVNIARHLVSGETISIE
jgi:hypothetical protein